MPESSPAVSLPVPPLAALRDARHGLATATDRLTAVARRSYDPVVASSLALLATEFASAPVRHGFGADESEAAILRLLDHLIRCVDDGAPAVVVAGRVAAISGALAVRAVA